MAEKNTVAMFVQDENGERVQVGWASPRNNEGVRTFEYSPGFEGTSPRDVSFEDDEIALKQQAAERVDASPDETNAAEPVDAAVDEPVELNTGGEIVDTLNDEEAAEFAELLAQEQAEEAADTNVEDEDEQPQTRRERRDNEN